jgi:hypothetical protein
MAATYHLMCMDCGRYLSVGKVYWKSPTGAALGETTFDGIYDPGNKTWRKRDEMFGRTVEAFLIRHRNHELRFVPEGVDELLDTPERGFEPVDPGELTRQPGGEPDPESELEAWKSKVRRSREKT